MEGKFKGPVTEAKWGGWKDEDTNRTIPILTLTVEIKIDGETKQVFPSLFFSPDLKTSGNDAGRPQSIVSLEVLGTYLESVDSTNLSANNPASFKEEIIGQEVNVFVKEDNNGDLKVYLNKRGRPELSESDLGFIWQEIDKDTKAAQGESTEDDGLGLSEKDSDDIPFD